MRTWVILLTSIIKMNASNPCAEKRRKAPFQLVALILSALVGPASAGGLASQCHGTVNKGSIEHSVQLPMEGKNFSAYSSFAASTGRTYVHAKVADIIVAAYAALLTERPASKYAYGETGLASGGRFRPHRSHQNGTSVDFFVPVTNAAGESVLLPTGITTRFGYDIEFDGNAKYQQYSIDFEAMAEHLYQLHQSAKARGADFALVIFDSQYLPKLFATRRGPYLQQHLPFMKGKPWVRHDEHYHIDFAVTCQLAAG
jgi:penicillin-insensitive murein endopeptidase